MKDESDKDRFGRLLRYVLAGDILVNAELVREGLAEAKRYEPDVKFADCFDGLMQEARDRTAGYVGTPALTPILTLSHASGPVLNVEPLGPTLLNARSPTIQAYQNKNRRTLNNAPLPLLEVPLVSHHRPCDDSLLLDGIKGVSIVDVSGEVQIVRPYAVVFEGCGMGGCGSEDVECHSRTGVELKFLVFGTGQNQKSSNG